jgi:hypothetical protein
MSDRRNRLILTIFALILFVAALLALVYGVGVFGEDRASEPVIDENVIHRWNNNGAGSFAVLGAVGFVVFAAGCILAAREWRRNGGRKRAGTVAFSAEVSDRGTTTLDSASLSHTLEADLKRLPDVCGALVGLFGGAPDVELRTVLDVSDQVNLNALAKQFGEAMDRFTRTVGFRPHPIQVTLRFRGTGRERHLR